MSDRILILYEGEVMGIVSSEEAELGEIGLMMAGTHRKGTGVLGCQAGL